MNNNEKKSREQVIFKTILIFLIIIACFVWFLIRVVKYIACRDSQYLYSVVKAKVENKDRLNPENLKKEFEKIISLKNACNYTDAKSKPNYVFLSKDGNPFNLPQNAGSDGIDLLKTLREKKQRKGKEEKIRGNKYSAKHIEKLKKKILNNASASLKTAADCANEPIEVLDNVDCVFHCKSQDAILISKTNGIFKDKLLRDDKYYCYVRKENDSFFFNDDNDDDTDEKEKNDESFSTLCSNHTGFLVYTVNSSWECKCLYPMFFSGEKCDVNVACPYDNKKFRNDPNWQYENVLVDYDDDVSVENGNETNKKILTHVDISKTRFATKLRNASVEQYIEMINDSHFFINNMIRCQCHSGIDIYGNSLLRIENTYPYFTNFAKCFVNPCKLTRVADSLVSYSKDNFSCTPLNQDHHNVLRNDTSTPFAGSVPFIGLRPQEKFPKYTSHSLKSEECDEKKNEEIMKQIATEMISPIILPPNQDHTNKTKAVLYLPVDQISFGARIAEDYNHQMNSVLVRAPEIYENFGDSLPILTFGPVPSHVAFYVHPIENVLGNFQPQNPIDFDLLHNQALENSRMICGNVIGGHETLMHSLFSKYFLEKKKSLTTTSKLENMKRLFNVTRLKNPSTRVMISIRVSSLSDKNNIFLKRASFLCSDFLQKAKYLPSYTDKLFVGSFFRNYRSWAALAGLKNINEAFDTFMLHDKESNKFGLFNQLIAPTSLYAWNSNENSYPFSFSNKISNQIKKITKNVDPFSSTICRLTRENDISKVKYNQLADFWFEEDKCKKEALFKNNIKKLKKNNESDEDDVNDDYTQTIFHMGLNYYPQSIKNIDVSLLRTRPVNLHHKLVNNFPVIYNEENSSTGYLFRNMEKVLSSMVWNNLYDTDRFDISYHLTDEEPQTNK